LLLRLELSRSFCNEAGKDTAEIRELAYGLNYEFGINMYHFIILNLRGEFTKNTSEKLATLNSIHQFFSETNDTSALIRVNYLLGVFHKNFADAFDGYKVPFGDFFESMLDLGQASSFSLDQANANLLYLTFTNQSGLSIEDKKMNQILDLAYQALSKYQADFRTWCMYHEYMGMSYLSSKTFDISKALFHFRAILDNLNEGCDQKFVKKYKTSLAIVLYMEGQLDSALNIFLENYRFYKQKQLAPDNFILNSTYGIAKIYEQQSQFENALLFRNAHDSIKGIT
jgi:tetratricopeptide (TPR) repeat protein